MRTFFILPFFVFSFLLFTLLPCMPKSFAEDFSIRKIRASAQAEVRIEASLSKLQFAVEKRSDSAKEASQEVARTMNAVLEWLRQQPGVSKLQTENISLQALYDYKQNQSERLIGYQAVHQASCEIELSATGAVLDELLNKGVSRISSIAFHAETEKLQQARQEAIALATLQAQKEAFAALKALGFSKKDTLSIEVFPETGNIPQPIHRDMRIMAAESVSSQIEGGSLAVSAAVQVLLSY